MGLTSEEVSKNIFSQLEKLEGELIATAPFSLSELEEEDMPMGAVFAGVDPAEEDGPKEAMMKLLESNVIPSASEVETYEYLYGDLPDIGPASLTEAVDPTEEMVESAYADAEEGQEAEEVKAAKMQKSFTFQSVAPGVGDQAFFIDVNLLGENSYSIVSGGNGIFDREGIKVLRKQLKYVLNQEKNEYDLKNKTEGEPETDDNYYQDELPSDGEWGTDTPEPSIPSATLKLAVDAPFKEWSGKFEVPEITKGEAAFLEHIKEYGIPMPDTDGSWAEKAPSWIPGDGGSGTVTNVELVDADDQLLAKSNLPTTLQTGDTVKMNMKVVIHD